MRLQRTFLASLLAVPLSLMGPASAAAQSTFNFPPGGHIDRFAGTGEYRDSGDPIDEGVLATDAAFMTPSGIAMDPEGNLYIADKNDNLVRRVDAVTHRVTTVAGTPGAAAGFSGDGLQATAAQLHGPMGIAIDRIAGSDGTTTTFLYIADFDNQRIRRVDLTSGIITTVAGSDAPHVDTSVPPSDPSAPPAQDVIGDSGAATSAHLFNPIGLAIDAAHNIYIADQGHRVVRKVDTNGIITTVAGLPYSGDPTVVDNSGDGGAAGNARLRSPRGLAFDAAGNLYIADQYNHRIRRVDTAGIITTFAGNGLPAYTGDGGAAASAQLNEPVSLSFDPRNGDMFVTDQGNHYIRKIDATANHNITTVAGVGIAMSNANGYVGDQIGNGGLALKAHLSPFVNQTVVGANYLYFADYGNDIVRVINLDSVPVARITLASIPANVGVTFTVTGDNCTPGTHPASATLGWTQYANCSVTANVPAGYTFNGWQDGSTDATRSFTATASNATYTVQLAVIPPPPPPPPPTPDPVTNPNPEPNPGNTTPTPTPVVPSGLRFVPVAPCRIADTREEAGPFGAPVLGEKSTREFAIPQSRCGIPGSAKAYSLNFTVVPVKQLSYLTVFPTGETMPVASTLNSYDGRIKANAAIVPAGANGAVSVYATDATQLIIDINGYFVPASEPSALAFYPMAPCRIADTRQENGMFGTPAMAGKAERIIPVVLGSCNVPPAAKAYSLNYTVVPKGPLGYLTTWPTGGTRPLVSTLNASTGSITANAAIVPAGNNGDVSVYVTDETQLIIDINGYFAPAAEGGLSLYNLSPCRVEDSREPSAGAKPILNTMGVTVAGHCGVPADAQSYIFNATVVPTEPLLYLTLWPNGTGERPTVSALNAPDAAVTSNMAIVPTSDGAINAFASHSTHVILDIFGYFAK